MHAQGSGAEQAGSIVSDSMDIEPMETAGGLPSSTSVELCHAHFAGHPQGVYLDAQFHAQHFDEPRQFLPGEVARTDWTAAWGSIYFFYRSAVPRRAGDDGRTDLGELLACYYPEPRGLTVWALQGVRGMREIPDGPLWSDRNVTAIWRGVEAFLVRQFPATSQIVTLAEPYAGDDENRAWQDFLTMHGYNRDPNQPQRMRKALQPS